MGTARITVRPIIPSEDQEPFKCTRCEEREATREFRYHDHGFTVTERYCDKCAQEEIAGHEEEVLTEEDKK